MLTQINARIGEETKHETLYIDGVGLSELPQGLLVDALRHFEQELIDKPWNWRDSVICEHLKTEWKRRSHIS